MRASAAAPAALPTGTVTFLFTDVEGSTRLWERHPDQTRAALVTHDAIVELLAQTHGGQVVRPRGEGDSRFCVFPRASDAVRAGAAIQQALHDEPWPPETPIRVRMSLHTGEADLRDGDYYGSAVNRAARIRSLAHGGQTLLSQATFDLVQDTLPPHLALKDLGEHGLKDLGRPERIFQLASNGLPDAFPPLKSLDTLPNNLPRQATPFIGREREVAAIAQRLAREDIQLLTLTGPGGTGKTRLALQAAADVLESFEDGVFFVPLASTTDPTGVIRVVGHALGVPEDPTRSAADALAAHLRDKRLLLVLDNFEQVVDAAGDLSALLARCPGVKALVTSRTVLHVYGEHDFPVPPLTLPDPHNPPPVERLTQYESVRLFIEHAQAARPDFHVTDENAPAVAEICHRLDGLPLAIELAAARVRLLTPQAMLARLGGALTNGQPGGAPGAGERDTRRLALLTGGARDLPARQQTLRGAIAWSHDLLSSTDRVLFRRLAVFAGGCTIESAEAIVAGDGVDDVLDGLASLVDKSLVRRVDGGSGDDRFVMLETIREFALERLAESGEGEPLRRTHASYFAGFSERAASQFLGADQRRWFAILDAEWPNLRDALTRPAPYPDSDHARLRIAASLGAYWLLRGRRREARDLLEAALAHATGAPPGLHARLLDSLAVLCTHLSDAGRALELKGRAIALGRSAGDPAWLGRVLVGYAMLLLEGGDVDGAAAAMEEATRLRSASDDHFLRWRTANGASRVALYQGDEERAYALAAEALVHARALGNPLTLIMSLRQAGAFAVRRGEFDAAEAQLRDSLALSRENADPGGIAATTRLLGSSALRRGDPARALELAQESIRLWLALGDRRSLAFAILVAACALAELGDAAEAARLFGSFSAFVDRLGVLIDPVALDDDLLSRGEQRASASLGPTDYTTNLTAGRSLTLEDAAASILARTFPSSSQPTGTA